MNKSVTAI